MRGACERMNVEACDLHFWDDEGVPPHECQIDPKTKGVSAVQFLLASSIVLHALELRREVYVNMFSCQEFDDRTVSDWAVECFGGRIVWRHVIHRGLSERTLNTHPDDLDMLAFGLERIEKLCDWAANSVGANGNVCEFDPDGTAGLSVDYQDLCGAVTELEAGLRKIGLLAEARSSTRSDDGKT